MTKAAAGDSSPTRGLVWLEQETTKDRAKDTKTIRNTKTFCTLYKYKYCLSSYTAGRIKSNRNDITLRKEGDNSINACGADQTFHSQLGPNDTRLVGITDHAGVLTTANNYAGARGSTCRDGVFRGTAELDFSRNTNVNSKGSSELTGSSPARFCLPAVSGPQKGWRFPASSELEGPQQIHPRRTLQDGGIPHGEGSGETGRLVSKDRFEGCILSDPSVCWAPEVSAVHLEGKSLSVPLPSIRTVMCPTSLHKGYETSSGLSQRKGNKINNLLGRPSGHYQQPTVFEYSDQFEESNLKWLVW